MPLLSPADAVLSAKKIYSLIDRVNVREFGSHIHGKFIIKKDSRFKGVAGASIFKYESGFGLAAKGTGVYNNEALIVIRGTNTLIKDLLLTDGNIGLQYTASGHTVHAGFNKVFRSFEKDLIKFFRGYMPYRVHCVGHSLGGALATIVAEWIARNKASQPILYTFGSPRVGLEGFGKSLTTQIGANNIYRAYHRTDVVSMVPLWPFMHVPQPGIECFLESPGFAPGIAYHKTDKYLQSIGKAQNWDDLRRKEPPESLDTQLETWLASDSFVALTANTIHLVSESLRYILKKILLITGIGVQTVLITGLTLLDRIAIALEQAAAISKDISGLIKRFIAKIAKALGIAAVDTGKLSFELIKWLLVKFSRAAYDLAQQAIRIVHQ